MTHMTTAEILNTMRKGRAQAYGHFKEYCRDYLRAERSGDVHARSILDRIGMARDIVKDWDDTIKRTIAKLGE